MFQLDAKEDLIAQINGWPATLPSIFESIERQASKLKELAISYRSLMTSEDQDDTLDVLHWFCTHGDTILEELQGSTMS